MTIFSLMGFVGTMSETLTEVNQKPDSIGPHPSGHSKNALMTKCKV